MTDWSLIASRISEITGHPFEVEKATPVGGGCINTAVRLSGNDQRYFVKLNSQSLLSMFEAEMAGLKAMADSDSIRVPMPLITGTIDGQSYLVMENIQFGSSKNGSAAKAGQQLALMHQATQSQFGWTMDNTIGSTPQPNNLTDDWIEFWRDQRLGFQLSLAAKGGYRGSLQRRGEQLLESFPGLMDHDPRPSLLHGDLWGGNMGYDAEGEPVIFDPAVYYGDREADIAMTELFGGPGQAFYAAYNDVWPLDSGYSVRKDLYNLYHILNHVNLFGSGYLGQAEGLINRLLAEVGH